MHLVICQRCSLLQIRGQIPKQSTSEMLNELYNVAAIAVIQGCSVSTAKTINESCGQLYEVVAT